MRCRLGGFKIYYGVFGRGKERGRQYGSPTNDNRGLVVLANFRHA